MAIKFILDNAQKKEEALVNEILQTIKQKPKMEDRTKKLATFIDVMFRTSIRKSQIENAVENITGKPKVSPRMFKPAPQELEKKEYLLRVFDNPVGVVIEKEDGKYLYQVIEPHPEPKIINIAKKLIKEDFKRNHKVVEDKMYLQGQITKACKQLKLKCDHDLVRRTTYYIKRDLLGFRRIDPLMNDINVREIHCEGINKPINVKYAGVHDKVETNIVFKNPKDLNVLIRRIAAHMGIKVTSKAPVLNQTINGFKIHATAGVSGVSSKLLIKKLE